MIYQELAHRKLQQAFDAILQQFSSNGNRKSVLSANRSFQAQNSTCSTLLQTMLLYETCIVLSRKCLWDVNTDFSHQWRSLVITTLSARAIYRQIPVSYLQTWYVRAIVEVNRRHKSNEKGSYSRIFYSTLFKSYEHFLWFANPISATARPHKRCSKWPASICMKACTHRVKEFRNVSKIPDICWICWQPCCIRTRSTSTLVQLLSGGPKIKI